MPHEVGQITKIPTEEEGNTMRTCCVMYPLQDSTQNKFCGAVEIALSTVEIDGREQQMSDIVQILIEDNYRGEWESYPPRRDLPEDMKIFVGPWIHPDDHMQDDGHMRAVFVRVEELRRFSSSV